MDFSGQMLGHRTASEFYYERIISTSMNSSNVVVGDEKRSRAHTTRASSRPFDEPLGGRGVPRTRSRSQFERPSQQPEPALPKRLDTRSARAAGCHAPAARARTLPPQPAGRPTARAHELFERAKALANAASADPQLDKNNGNLQGIGN